MANRETLLQQSGRTPSSSENWGLKERTGQLLKLNADIGKHGLFPRGQCHFTVNCASQILTHTFNGPFSGTTRVSRYQNGKTNLDFTEARDSEWQWHQLGHIQVCTLLQTDNHASNPPLSFYRPDALPAAQPTASKH